MPTLMTLTRSLSSKAVPPELTPAVAAVPTLVEFIRNVPPPLTVLLVQLAPHVQFVRRFAEILSWKASYSESWLVLGAWWGICLLSDPTLRFVSHWILFFLHLFNPYRIDMRCLHYSYSYLSSAPTLFPQQPQSHKHPLMNKPSRRLSQIYL